MKRKLCSMFLAMALTVTSVLPVTAQTAGNIQDNVVSGSTDGSVKTNESAATDESAQIAALEVCVGDDAGAQRRISVDLTEEQSEIVLKNPENVVEIKAYNGAGQQLAAGKDFTVQSESGNPSKLKQSGNDISWETTCEAEDDLVVSDAEGQKITVIRVREESEISDVEDIKRLSEDRSYTDITLEEEKNVVVSDYEKVYYRFIPEVTGKYKIYSFNCYDDPKGYLYDASWNELTYDDDGGEGWNFCMIWDLVAGETYYIGAGSCEDEDNYTLKIERKKGFQELKESAAALSIPEGSTVSESQTLAKETGIDDYYDRFVSFTAAENGYYLFSIANEKQNYYAPGLLQENGEAYTVCKIARSYEDDISIYTAGVYLEADETCYLGLEYGYEDDNIDSYEVSVTKKPAVTEITPVLRDDAKLVYGQGGEWKSYINEDDEDVEYYLFSVDSVSGLYTYKVTFEDGTDAVWYNSNDDGRMSYTTNQSSENPWLPGITGHQFTVRADGVEKTVETEVVPELKVTGISVSLRDEDGALQIGDDGSLYNEYNPATGEYERYYKFYINEILNLYQVEITYEDGSTERGTISYFQNKRKIEYTINQSVQNPWIPGGTNNILTVKSGDITETVNVPVRSYAMLYEECPQLTEEVAAAVSYNGQERSGTFRFTPAASGMYYFYSAGSTDTYMELYNEYGVMTGSDDDTYDGSNFLVAAALEAGKIYIVKTRTYSWDEGEYTVCATKKEQESSGYKSLEGVDLSGKYINLALVVDTTGSMSGIINNVRTHLTEFVDAIAGTHATLRIALIDYKDITCDEETVLHYAPDYSLWFENSDVEELKKQIAELDAEGGGDLEESVVDALGNVAKPDIMMFNAAAAKFAFLVTDAPYKEENTHGFADMDALIAALKAQNIATSVITEKGYYSYYQKLSGETGGELINVESDFSSAMGRFAAKIAAGTEDYAPDTSIIPVKSISLGSDLSVPEGKIRNFKPVILPENATVKSVTWTVENPEIAQIVTERTTEETLVVRGITAGTTKIIARTKDGGYAASFEFKVEKAVKTDSTVETCDISSIMADLDDAGSARVQMIYYGDVVPTVAAADQIAIYNKIAATDKNISYVYSDADGDMLYRWKFNGKEISNPNVAVNMETKINESGSATAAAAQSAGMAEYATVDFSHNGDLPGTAHISTVVRNLPDGNYALYYYNPATGKLELCDRTVVVSGNIADFAITHCSSYVIAKETAVNVQKIKISGDTKKVAAGKKLALKATVSPDTATQKDVTWSTSNKKYATVNSKGVVTTKKAGAGKKVTITATAKDGSKVKGTYQIQIAKGAVKKVSITSKVNKLKVNKKIRLKTKVTVSAKDANKTLKWSSGNSKYATVNSKGVVTAKKAGKGKTVIIKAQALDGSGKTAKIKIKITK